MPANSIFFKFEIYTWIKISCEKILIWLFIYILILIEFCSYYFMCFIVYTPNKIGVLLIMKCSCI